jgi:hypothetical protein
MTYYRGDYYQHGRRGDYYRGDPFSLGSFLGGLGKTVAGTVAGFAAGGPVGAILGGVGGLKGALGGGGAAIPMPGGSQPYGGIEASGFAEPGPKPKSGIVGAFQRLIPGGETGYLKRRRMNVTNPRALRRAIRRVSGFGKLVQRSKRAIGRANTAVGNKARGSARRKR